VGDDWKRKIDWENDRGGITGQKGKRNRRR
jgi:hypothetical protein